MQRSSTRFLILCICVMAVIAVIASSLAVFLVQNLNQDSNDINAVPMAASSINANNDFSAGFLSEGDGLADGDVPGGSSYYKYHTGYTTENGTDVSDDWSVLSNQITGSGKYYMNSNLTLNLSSFVEDTTFSGTLDGCGYTLTINCSKNNYTAGNGAAHCWGALTGTLSGTIKNIKIVTNFYWKNTSDSNKEHAVGGVAGTLADGAIIQNCYITSGAYQGQTYNMDYSGKPTGTSAFKTVGGIAGKSTGTVNISNTTVQIDNLKWNNSNGGSWTGRPDCYVGMGGFVGYNTGSLYLTNVSLCGSGQLYSYAQNGGDGGHTDLFKGGYVGCTTSTVNISGSINSWSGGTGYGGGCGWNFECSMIGEADDASKVSITNAFYTTGSNAYTNGYFLYQIGKQDNTKSGSIARSGTIYSCSNSQIGFCHKSSSNIWIGNKSTYSFNANSTTGTFTSGIKVADTTLDVSFLAQNGVFDAYVPMIDKTKIDGTISTITSGNYGYVGTDFNKTTSGASFTSPIVQTSAGVVTNTFIAQAGTNTTLSSEHFNVYRNGSIVDSSTLSIGMAAVGDVSGLASGLAGDYEYSKALTDLGALGVFELNDLSGVATGQYGLNTTLSGTSYFAVFASGISQYSMILKLTDEFYIDTTPIPDAIIYDTNNHTFDWDTLSISDIFGHALTNNKNGTGTLNGGSVTIQYASSASAITKQEAASLSYGNSVPSGFNTVPGGYIWYRIQIPAAYTATYGNYYYHAIQIAIDPIPITNYGTISVSNSNAFFVYSLNKNTNTSYSYNQIYNGTPTSFSNVSVTWADGQSSNNIAPSIASITNINTYTITYTAYHGGVQNVNYETLLITVNAEIIDVYRLSSVGSFVGIGEEYGTSSGSLITAWNSTYASGDGNYYLNSDIYLNTGEVYEDGTVFSGVLDGRGHTIYINETKTESDGMSSDHQIGFLFGTFSGVLKNVNIVVTSCLYERHNSRIYAQLAVGILAGRCSGGTFSNVNITYNNTATSDSNGGQAFTWVDVDSASGYALEGGLLCGRSYGMTINNVTITLNQRFRVYAYKQGTNNGSQLKGGLVCGRNNGVVNINNLTIKGSGNIQAYFQNINTDNVFAGIIAGTNEEAASINLNGLKIGGWTGTQYSASSNHTTTSGTYAGWNGGTISAQNVYYTTGNTFASLSDQGTVSYKVTYAAALENLWGFSPELGTSSFYIQLPNSYNNSTHLGNYTVTVTNGTAVSNVYSISAPAKEMVYFICGKSNTAGTLQYNAGGVYRYWNIYPTSGGSKDYDAVETDVYIEANSGGLRIDDESTTSYNSFYSPTLATTPNKLANITGANLISFTPNNYNKKMLHAASYTISIASGYDNSVYYESSGAYATFFLTDINNWTYTINKAYINYTTSTVSAYAFNNIIAYKAAKTNGTHFPDGGDFFNSLINSIKTNSSPALQYSTLIDADSITFSLKNTTTAINGTNQILNAGTYYCNIKGGNDDYEITGGNSGYDLTITINPLTFSDLSFTYSIDPALFSNAGANTVGCDGVFTVTGGGVSSAFVCTYVQSYNSYATTFTSINAYIASTYGTADQTLLGTVSVSTVTNVADSTTLTYTLPANANGNWSAITLATIAVTINKYKVELQLNDARELYDSRLDVTTVAGQKYYDFIYVKDQAGLSTTQGVMFTDPWVDNYASYFSISTTASAILARGTNSQQAVTATIGAIKYTTVPANTAGTQYPFTFNISVSDSDNISTEAASFMSTTGAASDYYFGYGSSRMLIGEAAIADSPTSGMIPRVIVIAQTVVEGAPQMGSENAWKTMEDFANATNGSLHAFISTHYYDTTTAYGFGGTVSTYAHATTYQFNGNVLYNYPVLGNMILPAYKTIDGQNYTFASNWVGGDENQIVLGFERSIYGARFYTQSSYEIADGIYTIAATPTVSRTIQGTTYYAAGDLVSINYGTIKNVTVSLVNEFHAFKAFDALNTSYGVIAGINYGSILQSSVTMQTSAVTTHPTQHSTITAGLIVDNAHHVVVGGVAGINYAGNILGINVTSANTSYVNMGSYTAFGTAIRDPQYVNGDPIYDNEGNPTGEYEQVMESNYPSKITGANYSNIVGGITGFTHGGDIEYFVVFNEGSLIVAGKDVVCANAIGINSYTKAQNLSIMGEGTIISSAIGDNYVSGAIAVADNTNADNFLQLSAGRIPLTYRSSIIDGYNAIKNIYVGFEGAVTTSGTTYMGIAFAKSATQTNTNENYAYKAIVLGPSYKNEPVRYTTQSSYGYQTGVGLSSRSIMGVGTALTSSADLNFVTTSIILTNIDSKNIAGVWTYASEDKLYLYSLDRSRGNVTFVRLFNETNTSKINSDDPSSYTAQTTPKQIVENTDWAKDGNTAAVKALGLTDTEQVIFVSIDASYLQGLLHLYTQASTPRAHELEIMISFASDEVEIRNVFELAQFMWYDGSYTTDQISHYYVGSYLNQAILTPVNGGNAITPASIGITTYNSFTSSVQDIRAGHSNTSYYYAASRARLMNDIQLDRYTHTNGTTYVVDLEWINQSWYEYAQDKILDGQDHTITIAMSAYDNGRKSDLPEESEWRNEYGYAAEESEKKNEIKDSNFMAEDNVTNTGESNSAMIAGGFIGIQRGTIKNINFVYNNNIELIAAGINTSDQADSDIEYLWGFFLSSRALYFGLISGYCTGTIDNCTLTMSNNSSVLIAKSAMKDNVHDREFFTTTSGGFTGFLGDGGVISNSSFDMKSGSKIITIQSGEFTHSASTWFTGKESRGDVYNYLGGLTGYMTDGALVYNAKLSGDDNTVLAALAPESIDVDHDTNYMFYKNQGWAGNAGFRFHPLSWRSVNTFSGGITGYTAGTINGVINNWRGTVVSCYNNDSPSDTTQYRKGLYYSITAGTCICVSENANVSNLYYTFPIDTFEFKEGTYTSQETAKAKQTAVMGTVKRVIYDLIKRFTTDSANSAYKDRNVPGKYLDKGRRSENADNEKQELEDWTVSANYTNNEDTRYYWFQDAAISEGSIQTKSIGIYIFNGANTDAYWSDANNTPVEWNGTTKRPNDNSTKWKLQLDLGDVLNWANQTINSGLTLRFNLNELSQNAQNEILWSLITANCQETNNQTTLQDAEGINKVIYAHAITALSDAYTKKIKDYSIARGDCSNAGIYFVTGNIGYLAPDTALFKESETNVYYPMKAVVYDGVTTATSAPLSVYSITNEKLNIQTDNLGLSFNTTFDTGNGVSYVVANVTAQNYVPSTYWISDGVNYVVDDSLDFDPTKTYYTQDLDYKQVGAYAINYKVFNSETVDHDNTHNHYALVVDNSTDGRCLIFNKESIQNYKQWLIDGETSDATVVGQDGQIDTYEIHVVIAPITANVTGSHKSYDGYNAINSKRVGSSNQSNYSNYTLDAIVNGDYFYLVDAGSNWSYNGTTHLYTASMSSSSDNGIAGLVVKDGETSVPLYLEGTYNGVDATQNTTQNAQLATQITYSMSYKFTFTLIKSDGTFLSISMYTYKNERGQMAYAVYDTGFGSSYLVKTEGIANPTYALSSDAAVLGAQATKTLADPNVTGNEHTAGSPRIIYITRCPLEITSSSFRFNDKVITYDGVTRTISVADLMEGTGASVSAVSKYGVVFDEDDFTWDIAGQLDDEHSTAVTDYRNVGTYYVSLAPTGIVNGENYEISGFSSLSSLSAKVIVIPKVITVNSASKTYNGSTLVTITSANVSGLCGADTVSITGHFNSANATTSGQVTISTDNNTYSYINGAGQTVTVNSCYRLTGNGNTTNYAVASKTVSGNAFTIAKRVITNQDNFTVNIASKTTGYEYSSMYSYSGSDVVATIQLRDYAPASGDSQTVSGTTFNYYENETDNSESISATYKFTTNQGSVNGAVTSVQNVGTYYVWVQVTGTNYESDWLQHGSIQIVKQTIVAAQVTSITVTAFEREYLSTGWQSPSITGARIQIKDKYDNRQNPTLIYNNTTLTISSTSVSIPGQANAKVIGGYAITATAISGASPDASNYNAISISGASIQINGGNSTYYITPAEITIDRVYRDFTTANDTASNANTVYVGADEHGTITWANLTGLSGEFDDGNVTNSGTFTISNSCYETEQINGTDYDVLLINYCLASDTATGIIIPLEATIANVSKIYDTYTTLTYTGSQTVNASTALVTIGDEAIGITRPSGAYSAATVGNCNMVADLASFSYDDKTGATITLYRIKDNGTPTNYYQEGANAESFTIAGIAYIIPLEAEIEYVAKVYDGTVNFTNSTTYSVKDANTHSAVSTTLTGEFVNANVKYENSKYNDVLINTTEYTYEHVVNGEIVETSVYRLAGTNYAISLSESVTYSSNQITCVGVGVIIPQTVTITSVTKVYNMSADFDTIDATTHGTITTTSGYISDASNPAFYFSGTLGQMGVTSAPTSVTVNTTNFPFNGTNYLWLKHVNNTTNNYCVAAATTQGVGTITEYSITPDSGSSTPVHGKLVDFGFTGVYNGTNLTRTKVDSVVYYKDKSCSIANFTATFKFNNTTYTLQGGNEGGTITLSSGEVLTFVLTDSAGVELANTISAPGSYSLKLRLKSSSCSPSDFAFNDAAFTLEIAKQTLKAENITVNINSIRKDYDGTASTATITGGSVGSISAKDASNTDTITSFSTKTFSHPTLSGVSNCIDAGTYSGKSVTGTLSLANNYYTFSGSFTTTVTYIIDKKEMNLTGAFTKAFDGSSNIEVAGVNDEVVIVKLNTQSIVGAAAYNATSATTVGAYKKDNNNNMVFDSHDNYTWTVTSTTLTITQGKNLVVERQLKNITNSDPTFVAKIALAGLTGLDFLAQGNNTLDAAAITSLQNGENTYYAAATAAFANLFKVSANDESGYVAIDVSDLITESVKVYAYTAVDGTPLYAIEISYKGNSELDQVTLTDRYATYMVGYDSTVEGYLTKNIHTTNTAVSQSELADGQYDANTYNTAATAISTAAELITAITSGSGTYRLTNNIYGYNLAGQASAVAFAGTLYGNGYTIVLDGDYNTNANSFSGFFASSLASNGKIYDVNFKYIAKKEIAGIPGNNDTINNNYVGLIVGKNEGLIQNCSLEIINAPAIASSSTNKVVIGGFAHTSTGTLTNVTTIYSTSVTLLQSQFAGVAYTISGTADKLSVRRNEEAGALTISGFAMASTLSNTLVNAIDTISDSHTLKGTGTITNLYGQGANAVKVYGTGDLASGYINYFFASAGKYYTNSKYHNVYDANAQNKDNTTYYYNPSSTVNETKLAIEVLAPRGRFIWEAMNANYTTHEIYLNREVTFFTLGTTLTDSATTAACEQVQGLTFITHSTIETVDTYVTLFTPAIGMKVVTTITSEAGIIQQYEYTGSQITAHYTYQASGGSPISVMIQSDAQGNVGIYTTLMAEAGGGTITPGDNVYNVESRTATVTQQDGQVTGAKATLIVLPKATSVTIDNTKAYDGTTISETEVDYNSDSTVDGYIVGAYTGSAVTTNESKWDITLTSTTKQVLAVRVGQTNEYAFYTIVADADGSAVGDSDGSAVYDYHPVYISGSTQFTSATLLTSYTYEQISAAYAQLIDYSQVNATHTANMSAMGLTATYAYVYDIIFYGAVKNISNEQQTRGKISYTDTNYTTDGGYAYYVINTTSLGSGVSVNNYEAIVAGMNAFDKTTISPATPTTVANETITVVDDNGIITQRTITGAYSGNLNQSYNSKSLSQPTIATTGLDLATLPHSITSGQVTALEAEVSALTPNDDILANCDPEDITATGVENPVYTATEQEYKQVALPAANVSTTNFSVSVAAGVLTLRWFEQYGTETINDVEYAVYAIKNINDLAAIGMTENNNEYATLHYIVTKNINGKSKVLSPMNWDGAVAFTGKINGNNKVIQNIVITNTNNVALFTTNNGTICDLTLAQVILYASVNEENSTANTAVVANTNTGSITSVKVEAEVYSNATTTNLAAFANNQSTGSIASSKGYIETTVLESASNMVNRIDVAYMYRDYTREILTSGYKMYVGGTQTAFTSAPSEIKTLVSTYIIGYAPIIVNELFVPTIVNFRQYYVWYVICPWLTTSATINGYIVTNP